MAVVHPVRVLLAEQAPILRFKVLWKMSRRLLSSLLYLIQPVLHRTHPLLVVRNILVGTVSPRPLFFRLRFKFPNR